MKSTLRRNIVAGCLMILLPECLNTYSKTLNKMPIPDPGNRSLHFIPNQGQFHEKVVFCAKTQGYTLWLTADGITFDGWKLEKSRPSKKSEGVEPASEGECPEPDLYTRQTMRTTFGGVSETKRPVPLEASEHRVNFFVGKDPANWTTGVRTFREVLYQNLYPHIDLRVNGLEDTYTYRFIIRPGGDITHIKLQNEAKGALIKTEDEDLTISGGPYSLRHLRPSGFLGTGGTGRPVEVKMKLAASGGIEFLTEGYDRDSTLVIQQDVVVSLTEAAVCTNDRGSHIAVDSSGGAYVTGCTRLMDFPQEGGQGIKLPGGNDVFVSKLDPTGNSLVYSTYLGGTACDYGKGISVDSDGAVYITGITASDDFPTRNALSDSSSGGFDAFVAKIDPSGSRLVYSTYLGGSSDESGQKLEVDASGAVCLVGWTQSSDFPIRNAAIDRFSGRRDAFVTKIHPSGRSLVFSTYLGGSSLDFGKDISLGSSGTIWVTGYTGSQDFPVRDALLPELSGKLDAFVTQFDGQGSGIIFSTYLGGSSNDLGNAISQESNGSVFVTGYSDSQDFPLKEALDENLSGGADAFLTGIRAAGKTLVFSTFLGGSAEDSGSDITVDSTGSIFLTGYTCSTDFPAHNSLTGTLSGQRDAFVTKIDPSGSALSYSTFLGGDSMDCGKAIAVDRWGSAYVTGNTCSGDFPTGYAIQKLLAGREAAFVTKISSTGSMLVYSIYLGSLRGISYP